MAIPSNWLGAAAAAEGSTVSSIKDSKFLLNKDYSMPHTHHSDHGGDN